MSQDRDIPKVCKMICRVGVVWMMMGKQDTIKRITLIHSRLNGLLNVKHPEVIECPWVDQIKLRKPDEKNIAYLGKGRPGASDRNDLDPRSKTNSI